MRILFIFLFLFFSSSLLVQAQKPFVVVLDAGHGGKDPGKVARNYIEKDIALNIALLAGNKLKEFDGIEVVYTRQKDVFIELKQRGKIANDANGDLFVSVHCNAHNTPVSGSETYALGVHANKQNFEVAKQENSVIFLEDNYQEKYGGFDPNSPESVIGITLLQEEFLDQSLSLASIVESKFANELKIPSRGVKQAGFVVLHQTNMPAILIETGFITNPKEGEFLNSKTGQEKVAKVIVDAVLAYKKNLEQNTVVETAKPKQTSDTVAAGMKAEGLVYKVQIAAGSNKLDLKPYNFKGLKQVEMEKAGNLYKYYYGSTGDYNVATKKLAEAKKSGYPSAFIIGFKDGKVVPVN